MNIELSNFGVQHMEDIFKDILSALAVCSFFFLFLCFAAMLAG